MWRPIEIDPGQQDQAWWDRYHAFRRARAEEARPGEPVKPDAQSQEQMIARAASTPQNVHRHWVVEDEGRVVADLNWSHPKPDSPEYESNRHLVWMFGGVLGPWRRRGIGAELLRLATDLAEGAGAEVFGSWASEADGRTFLEAAGLEMKQEGGDNRLDLTAVDWGRMAEWDGAAAAKSDTVEWDWLEDEVPERSRVEYCAEISRLLNTMPFDDMDHGEIAFTAESLDAQYERMEEGALHHSLVAREGGRIVGMTDVYWEPSRPMRVQQAFTGVDPAARGKGVGTRLKTAMLLFLHRRHPEAEWVDTDNATSNGPMLAINHKLGFRNVRIWGVYQGPLAAVSAWASGRTPG